MAQLRARRRDLRPRRRVPATGRLARGTAAHHAARRSRAHLGGTGSELLPSCGGYCREGTGRHWSKCMTSQEVLREELQRIARSNGDEWYAGLEARKQIESEFHDRMRDSAQMEAVGRDQYEEFFSNHRFYRTAVLSRSYFFDWVQRHS